MVGKVRWLNKTGGYGFIVSGERMDIFFHRSEIKEEDFKKLSIENEVEFDLYEVQKGYEAKNVRKIS